MDDSGYTFEDWLDDRIGAVYVSFFKNGEHKKVSKAQEEAYKIALEHVLEYAKKIINTRLSEVDRIISDIKYRLEISPDLELVKKGHIKTWLITPYQYLNPYLITVYSEENQVYNSFYAMVDYKILQWLEELSEINRKN